jgi:hypothetical protein
VAFEDEPQPTPHFRTAEPNEVILLLQTAR